MNSGLPKITFWRVVAVTIALVGLWATFLRFTQGIAAVSHMSDQWPWGLWIGFDVLCGVGLAAGGFTICAVVYIFNLQKFHPITRPAVLTAFLGYLLVCAGLAFDLGRPWAIWHPLVYWNPRSVMFEVGWCVTLYTTVLALEFSPLGFERFRLRRPAALIHKLQIPIVIMGITLSTLHQSSLGSLFLILPAKVHPLWYTSILPVLFFVSALAAGIAMTVVESWFSKRVFGKPIETHLLQAMASEPIKPFLHTVIVYVFPGHGETYICQSDRGGLVMGGHLDGFPSYTREGRWDRLEEVVEGAIELFPQIGGVRILRQWAGTNDMTMDGSPIIDRLRYENVFLNAGWCYGGFKAIPASGAACAQLVATGTAPDLIRAFHLSRFATGHLLDERGGGPFPVRQ